MDSDQKVFEKHLHNIWQKQSFERSLQTFNHQNIQVLDPGIYNDNGAGPDFKHSRVQIGGLTYVGDIEIDLDYSDWKKHGHNIDSKYNKVILHVTLTNRLKQNFVFTKAGRKVPSISLQKFISDNAIPIENITPSSKLNGKFKCSGINEKVSYKLKKKFIVELGIQRFNKKSKRMLDRLKELLFISENNIKEPVIKYELSEQFLNREFTHEDFNNPKLWQQLLYEMIFEALGYSKNKSPMLKLAKYANLEFIDKLGTDQKLKDYIETSLFHISGIMPDVESLPENEVSEYERRLSEDWQMIKKIYDSKFLNETQWSFLNHRPQNFPTIRIAGGIIILFEIIHGNLIPQLIKKFEEIRSDKILINSVRSLFIVKSDGYWSNHYVFGKEANVKIKYFVGASRADEIVINVILPFLAVYFDIFGKKQLLKRVLNIFHIYTQRSDNKIVRETSEVIGLDGYKKRTIFAQGMIELFRGYCLKNKCLECEIGKRVFN